MSTDSFACRSSNLRNPHSSSSGERRRHWLRQRGLMSPHNGPSRRLANILPRKHSQSPASSRNIPQPHSSARIHLEVDHNSVPIVVAKPLRTHNDEDHHPPASRTVSMPADESSSRLRTSAFRSRSNHRRWMSRDPDRTASPPSRSRRLLNRLTRRSRDLPRRDVRTRASIDVPRARDRDVDRVSLHRHSLDRRRHPSAANTTSRPRARAVYTVFDKELPRHVLQGNSHFEESSWNDYREHIDELAEDAKFMDYLTAPVHRRPPLKAESGPTSHETQNLAVNKLYPLAFIRLLEAHAKYSAQSCEPCNPEDEEHRYDDVDRDDEARVDRTVSNGMYDLGRFRTVGGTNRFSCDYNSRPAEPQAEFVMPKLLDGKKISDGSPYPSRLFSRISRDSESASVPVC